MHLKKKPMFENLNKWLLTTINKKKWKKKYVKKNNYKRTKKKPTNEQKTLKIIECPRQLFSSMFDQFWRKYTWLSKRYNWKRHTMRNQKYLYWHFIYFFSEKLTWRKKNNIFLMVKVDICSPFWSTRNNSQFQCYSLGKSQIFCNANPHILSILGCVLKPEE